MDELPEQTGGLHELNFEHIARGFVRHHDIPIPLAVQETRILLQGQGGHRADRAHARGEEIVGCDDAGLEGGGVLLDPVPLLRAQELVQQVVDQRVACADALRVRQHRHPHLLPRQHHHARHVPHQPPCVRLHRLPPVLADPQPQPVALEQRREAPRHGVGRDGVEHGAQVARHAPGVERRPAVGQLAAVEQGRQPLAHVGGAGLDAAEGVGGGVEEAADARDLPADEGVGRGHALSGAQRHAIGLEAGKGVCESTYS